MRWGTLGETYRPASVGEDVAWPVPDEGSLEEVAEAFENVLRGRREDAEVEIAARDAESRTLVLTIHAPPEALWRIAERNRRGTRERVEEIIGRPRGEGES